MYGLVSQSARAAFLISHLCHLCYCICSWGQLFQVVVSLGYQKGNWGSQSLSDKLEVTQQTGCSVFDFTPTLIRHSTNVGINRHSGATCETQQGKADLVASPSSVTSLFLYFKKSMFQIVHSRSKVCPFNKKFLPPSLWWVYSKLSLCPAEGFQYTHTLFYCTVCDCTSQVFLLQIRQDLPPPKRLQLPWAQNQALSISEVWL